MPIIFSTSSKTIKQDSMKNFTLTVLKSSLFCLMLLLGQQSFGQVIFTSVPDSIAIVNDAYSYDVEATFAPGAPTYSLETAPSWMAINATTGLITGTPTLMTQGGRVTVKATNTTGSYYQNFYVYISDAVVCDPNLVSYWPLDNKIGTGLPDAANSHTARWIGTVEPVPTISSDAVTGNSLKFDPDIEDDEFYKVADQDPFQFQYADDFSVSFWFKNQPSAVDPMRHEVFIGRGQVGGARWSIFWNYLSGKVEFLLQDASTDRDTLISTPTISDNNWHHVVATFDGRHVAPLYDQESYFALYVDKSAATGTFDFYSDNFYMNAEVTLGWDNVFNYPYSGYLDEVAYYNKILTPAEVTALYNKGIAHQPICSPGNTAPILTSAAVTSATEDAAYSYTLTYRKMGGGTATLSAPVLPLWLNFNATTGVLSGTPSNDNVGNHDVTLRLTSGSIVLDQVFTIAVANVNDLPAVTSTAVTAVAEDAAYTYTITATDVDAGAILTYSAPTLPSWMSFNTTTHVLSGTPTNAEVGNHDVTLRVTDNAAASVDQSFTIAVSQVNDAPVINSQNALSLDEDNELAITLAALNVTDVDNTYPDDFTLTVKNGTNYTHDGNTISPAANWNGTLTVPVDLSDGAITVSYDLEVTVNAIDDNPAFTSTPGLAGATGTNYEYWITTSDPENQTRTLTCSVKPAWLTFTSNAGSGLLTGVPGNPGDYNITLAVTDGTNSVEQSFVITVTGQSAVGEIEKGIAIVYPNPASEYVTFEFAGILKAANIKVFTLNGMLVKEVNFSNQQSFVMDVTNMTAKEYIYRITSDKGEQTGKLLIQ
jgi:hypothetical protein